MKKIQFIITAIITMSLISCDQKDTINTVFDTTNGQTLVAFAGTNTNFPILVDESGSTTINVEVTTVSQSDRQVQFHIDESGTTASPDNYSLPTSITIPANSFIGTLTINGIDDDGLGTNAETITLILDSIEGDGLIDETPHVISIFQVCPVPSDFMTGLYLIEQVSALVDGPTLSSGSIVDLVANGSSRTFNTTNYPDYCSTNNPFTFNLVCFNINIPNQNSICSCGDGTNWFTQPITPETYDLDDDTEFFVTFTDDTQNNCGTPVQTTYKFTKQ